MKQAHMGPQKIMTSIQQILQLEHHMMVIILQWQSKIYLSASLQERITLFACENIQILTIQYFTHNHIYHRDLIFQQISWFLVQRGVNNNLGRKV